MAMSRRLWQCLHLLTILYLSGAVLNSGDQAYAAEDDATADLTILPYMAVDAVKDDLSIEITAADIEFAGPIEKKDTTSVTVFANIDVILRAPLSIVLTRIGGAEEQTTTVVIDVESSDGIPLLDDLSELPGFKQLLLPLGAYTGTPERPTVDVSVAKIWTIADIAGVYIGVLTLDLIPVP